MVSCVGENEKQIIESAISYAGWKAIALALTCQFANSLKGHTVIYLS
ncbi:hypothetical protein GXM_07077 [Nostoc sphaeroides CCNUC1]|uniref:Uncharacterized protein n=1 Tax=Nostoc sphaeroides CCNUC1 TaxID=2653204 RepID=A0A5P8W9W3_9NOSO|nr:hypothetical protein GXM_07077 [Nostoc sphaeroides CCNUC1]